MAGVDDLEAILRDLQKKTPQENTDSVVIKPIKPKVDLPEPVEPPWTDESNDEIATVPASKSGWMPSLQVTPKQPELVFMPMLLQSSFLPPKGSPEKYVRRFRNISLVSHTSFTPSGLPIGLPGGLGARRILLALITKSVYERSPVIEVPSIVELMRWCDLTMTGRSHKSTQRNLLQLATMNIDIWFSPTGEKARIFKGQMFQELSVDIEPSSQEKFSFIPDRVVFTDKFFDSVVRDKPMPFTRESILKASSPIEHDLMMWLSHRQSYEYLNAPQFLDYSLLQAQFGKPYQPKRNFKVWFKRALRSVIRKFERDIDVQKEGIVLHPMAPPAPLKQLPWDKW